MPDKHGDKMTVALPGIYFDLVLKLFHWYLKTSHKRLFFNLAKPLSGRTILENENGQARLEAYSFQQETTFELAQLV